MNTLRRSLFVAMSLIMIFSLALTACGKATETPAGEEPSVEEPSVEEPEVEEPEVEEPEVEEPMEEVELVLWTWPWDPLDEWIAERIAIFEEQNPGVTVTHEFFPAVGEGTLRDKLLSVIATGGGPDVFFILDVDAPRFASTGAVLPLDDSALEAMGYESIEELFEVRNWPSDVNDGWKVGGQFYGLTNEVSWLAVFLNENCMEDSGIDPDTVQFETWDDLIEVASKMSRFDEAGNFTREGFDLPVYEDDSWHNLTLSMFLTQTGGEVLSPDGTESWINKPEAVKAFEQMMEIHRSDAGSPDFGSPGIGGQFTDWLGGELICGVMYNPPMAKMSADAEVPFRAYAVPTTDGGKGNVFWGWAWQVNANSKHPDLAWKFMDVLTLDTEQHCQVSDFWIPVTNMEESQCVQENPAGEGFMESVKENPQFEFRSDYYPEIGRLLREVYEEILFNDADIQEALDAAAEDINDIVQQ